MIFSKNYLNILDDLIHCRNKLKEEKNGKEACICYCYEIYLVNEKTMEINIP